MKLAGFFIDLINLSFECNVGNNVFKFGPEIGVPTLVNNKNSCIQTYDYDWLELF